MIDQYRAHIVKLADELFCDVKQEVRFKNYGMMFPEWEPKSYIEVPIIDDQIDYLINLHELGHIYHKHTCGRPPYQHKRFYYDNGVLRSEAEAWHWAFTQCIDNIQDVSRRFAWDMCMGTYYADSVACKGQPTRLHNGRRHHIEFIYDKPDAYFASVVAKIQGNLKDFKITFNID